jgi:hypothetical protein
MGEVKFSKFFQIKQNQSNLIEYFRAIRAMSNFDFDLNLLVFDLYLITVNLSFQKRYRDRYQTLASFFKAFEIFNNRSCN